jgi:heat shock protein HslJ
MMTLVVGCIGVAVANPALAQHFFGETQFMAQSSSIAGSWRLVNLTESSAPTPMVPPQTTALTADFADDRISGSGGCNRFMGSYQTEGEQLSISPLASTRMACEEAVMNQEMKYLMALQGAQRYEVNQPGQLQIFYQTEQGSGVLRFTAQTVRGLW